MLQKRACKIIIGNEYTNFESAKATLNIQSFEESVFLNKAKIVYKIANNMVPKYFVNFLKGDLRV